MVSRSEEVAHRNRSPNLIIATTIHLFRPSLINHILFLAANLVNQAKHRQKQRVSGSTANYVGAYVEIMHSDDFCSVIKISVRVSGSSFVSAYNYSIACFVNCYTRHLTLINPFVDEMGYR